MMATMTPGINAMATIRSGAFHGLGSLLQLQGFTANPICERVGIDPGLLVDPETRVAVRGYIEVLESAAHQTRTQALGMLLGSRQPLAAMGALAAIPLGAPDIQTAIRDFARAMPLHQEGARIEIEIDGPQALLSYSLRDLDLIEYRQDAELSIAKMLRFARVVLRRPDWTPAAVHFEHPAPRDTQAHRRLFGAPVYFAQARNALLFPSALLDAPFSRQRNPGNASQTAPAPPHDPSRRTEADLLIDLRRQLSEAMKRGEVSICESARAMGLSERTLQRRLESLGLTFNGLVERLRFELAKRHLRQRHLPLTEIGYLLGYSELSAFSRAFRRWAGVSPIAFRRQLCE